MLPHPPSIPHPACNLPEPTSCLGGQALVRAQELLLQRCLEGSQLTSGWDATSEMLMGRER